MADIKVELLDHMGSDLDVVNAARVSFEKESEWDGSDNQSYMQRVYPDRYLTFIGRDCVGNDEWGVLSESDSKLIHYLAKHGHWTPFAHTSIKFRIKAPIFVARQLVKHQVGLVWNEVSRRYVDSDPEFYAPKAWRKRAENVKQGSMDEPVSEGLLGGYLRKAYVDYIQKSEAAYLTLLKTGVAPEQARMVLPLSTMTEWIWTGSLAAFARVVKQRLEGHAQRECAEVAIPISDHCATLFPVSWEALFG